jgi:CHAT domain-containing protein/Tfp pilus assembly protein PilF
LAAAHEYHTRALAIRERLAPNSLSVATSLNNLGNGARVRGDLAAAHEYHTRALAIRERLAPNSLNVATSLNNLGIVAVFRADLVSAEEYFRRALTIRERLSPDSLEITSSFSTLGGLAFTRGDWAAARDHYRRALTIQERVAPDSLNVAELLNNLGETAHNSGDLAAARDYYDRALASWERLGTKSLNVAIVLNNLGRLALNQVRAPDAVRFFTRAIDIVEFQRSQIHSTEARALLMAQHTGAYTGLLRSHLALADLPAALETAERARARSLLEILTEARAQIRHGVDPLLLERERLLQQDLNDKAYRQMQVLSGEHNTDQAAAAKKQLDALLIQYQELQAQIRARSPRYADLTQPQPLTLPEIQQQVLDTDTLLLEYVLDDEASYVFAVTPTSIRTFELPKRADIELAARRMHGLLTARQPVRGETVGHRQARVQQADAGYPAAAAALSRMVLGPVAGQLSTKRLLIVADGALQYVPFSALPEPAMSGPLTITTEDGPPLILNHEIVSVPSASVVAVLRREFGARPPAERLVAVLADPVFDAADPRLRRTRNRQAIPAAPASLPADVERAVRSAGFLTDRGALSRLPFTRDEADAIVALTPAGQSTKAIDFNASRAEIASADLSRYRIVHLATHGVLNTEHPELSGIVLSLVDEQGRPQDGFLRLHDVYNLNWSADLVVLSACQTALGKEITGEGLVGLTRGFMYGGAERVLASLWNVNDGATAQFMKQFYQRLLAKELSPAAALRAAQVEMWKRRQWRSPYYWASFVLQGEWR